MNNIELKEDLNTMYNMLQTVFVSGTNNCKVITLVTEKLKEYVNRIEAEINNQELNSEVT